MNKILSSHIGRAGEYRVLSELLLREHNPAIMAIDNGIDIVLENGKTIQVKTVLKPNNGFGHGCNVTFISAAWKKGKKVNKHSRMVADFVIIWLVHRDEFFIISREVISNRSGISLGWEKSRFHVYRNNWDILNGLEVKT